MPVEKIAGVSVYAGSINRSRAIEIRVERVGLDFLRLGKLGVQSASDDQRSSGNLEPGSSVVDLFNSIATLRPSIKPVSLRPWRNACTCFPLCRGSNRRLLRARRGQPSHCRTAKERDELAPPHVLSPGPRIRLHPTQNGISRSGGSVTYFEGHRETHGMAAYIKGEGSPPLFFAVRESLVGTTRRFAI
jgi:hypothetical protein